MESWTRYSLARCTPLPRGPKLPSHPLSSSARLLARLLLVCWLHRPRHRLLEQSNDRPLGPNMPPTMASETGGDPPLDDDNISRRADDATVVGAVECGFPSIASRQGGDPPSPSLMGTTRPPPSDAAASTSDPESKSIHDKIPPTIEASLTGGQESAPGGATDDPHHPDAALPRGTNDAPPLVNDAERYVDIDHGPSPSSLLPPSQPPIMALEQHLERSTSALSSSTASPPTRRRRSPPARMASQESQESWATTNTASSQPSAALQPPQPQCTRHKQWYSSARDLFQSTQKSSTDLPLSQLRKLASQGCLDASHRGVSWRMLLQYIGTDRLIWSTELAQKRNEYNTFLQHLFVHPMDVGSELKQQPRRIRIPADSSSSSSDDADDEAQNEDDVDASTIVPPVPSAVSNDSSTTIPTEDATNLPATVVDAWKRSGRDYHILASVTSGRNALRYPPGRIDEQGEGGLDGETNDAASIDQFIRTAALLDEIRKDVNRTGCDLAFYLDPALGKRRHAALERILLVWSVMANANPTANANEENSGQTRPVSTATRYVQGMNEIVAVLYFVLTALEEDEDADEGGEDHGSGAHDGDANEEGQLDKQETDTNKGAVDLNKNDDSDPGDGEEANRLRADAPSDARAADCDGDWADHAEPDAYWLFHALLAEMGDVFAPDLDGSATGIQGRIDAMRKLLHRHDSETSEHLQGELQTLDETAIGWFDSSC